MPFLYATMPRTTAVSDSSAVKLPALFIVLLTAALCACTKPPPMPVVPAGATVLAFGDSITFGTGAGKGEDYPTRLAAATGWNIINAGVPGETTGEALERIDQALESAAPQLVILELGGNDFLQRRNTASIAANLGTLIERISQRDIPVVLVAVPELSLLRASIGRLSDAPLYAELAEDYTVLLVPDVLANILSQDKLRADPVHPNARGYALFSEGLKNAMEQAGIYAN